MANPFFVQSPQYGQGLQSLAQGVQQFGQQRKEEQRLQEAEEYKQRAKQAMAQAFQSGDPMAIRQAVIEYPEIAETATQMFGFTNDQTEKVARETYRRALSETDPARRQAIMEGGIETVRQFGGNPRNMASDLQMLRENPEGFERSARAGYAALASDQEFEAMFPEADGSGIGTYNPRDYTTQSFAEFARTKDPSVLERYEPTKIMDVGGVPHLFNPADRTITPGRITQSGFQPTGQPRPYQGGGQQPPSGQPAGGQQRPEEEITTESVASRRGEIISAEERAKLDSELAKSGYRLTENDTIEPIPGGEPAQERQAAEAAKTEQKRQAYQKADVMTNKIDSALNQVDWNSAGAIGQFLQFVGGTEARDLSANLETIQANLGFDALQDMRDASPTGGALGQVTEKEIRFLQGLIESLDQAQSPSQLRSNLQQLRKGVQKTRGMISGDISVVESEEEIANLPDGAEYIVADDPARSVRLKGGAGNIMQMNRQQLEALNPADMTDEQLQQAARRYEQLGAQ